MEDARGINGIWIAKSVFLKITVEQAKHLDKSMTSRAQPFFEPLALDEAESVLTSTSQSPPRDLPSAIVHVLAFRRDEMKDRSRGRGFFSWISRNQQGIEGRLPRLRLPTLGAQLGAHENSPIGILSQ